MRLIQTQKIRISHSLSQRIMLNQINEFFEEFKHPLIKGGSKGLEGMKKADEILKERKSPGVLIGSLAKKIYNNRRKPEELYECNDVDVAVLEDNFKIQENFEGGIDWWLPKQGYSGYTKNNWFENAHGIVLPYYLKKEAKIEPGLNFLGRGHLFYIERIICEEFLRKNKDNYDLEQAFLEKNENDLERKIKTSLPKFIKEFFKERIVKEYAIRPIGIDTEEISKIKENNQRWKI